MALGQRTSPRRTARAAAETTAATAHTTNTTTSTSTDAEHPAWLPPALAASPLVAAGLVLALAVGLSANTWQHGFVYDDARAVVTNPDVLGTSSMLDLLSHDFWGTPMAAYKSHKSFRPLTVLTFRANHWLSGSSGSGDAPLAPAFHLTNVALHGLVCVLFYRVCCVIFGTSGAGRSSAFAAAALFAAHPIHTEAVANIVGRAEILAGLFYLLAMLVYAGGSLDKAASGPPWGRLAAAVLLAAAAMFSKEQGIVVLGVLGVYDICCVCGLPPHRVLGEIFAPQQSRLRLRILLLAAAGAALLYLRVRMMGGQQPIFNVHELPAMSSPDWATRALTFNFLAAFNLYKLLVPATLCSDWSYNSIPLLESATDPRTLAIAATYIGTALVTVVACRGMEKTAADTGEDGSGAAADEDVGARSTTPTAARGGKKRALMRPESAAAAKARSTRPSAPSAGSAAVLGLAMLVLPFLPASNLLFYVGFVVAERVLYLPSMGICILVAAGCQALVQRRPKLRPAALVGILVMLALFSAKTVTRNAEWESDYTIHKAGVRDNPGNVKLVVNYGLLLHDMAKDTARPEAERRALLAEVESIYKKAMDDHPNYAATYFQYGNLLQEMGQTNDAIVIYKRGLETTDKTKTPLRIMGNLGTLLFRSKAYTEAQHYFEAVLQITPDDLKALNGLGSLHGAQQQFEKSEEYFRRLLEIDPSNVEGHFNYGTLLVHMGRLDEGEVSLRRALKLNPHHSGAKNNLEVIRFERAKARKNN